MTSPRQLRRGNGCQLAQLRSITSYAIFQPLNRNKSQNLLKCQFLSPEYNQKQHANAAGAINWLILSKTTHRWRHIGSPLSIKPRRKTPVKRQGIAQKVLPGVRHYLYHWQYLLLKLRTTRKNYFWHFRSELQSPVCSDLCVSDTRWRLYSDQWGRRFYVTWSTTFTSLRENPIMDRKK